MAVEKKPSEHIVLQGNPSSFYAEGLSQLMLGFPNSRVMLFNLATRDEERPDAPLVHNLACELVMPTPALLDMCRAILNHAAQASPMLKTGGQQWLAQVNEVLDSLNDPPQGA